MRGTSGPQLADAQNTQIRTVSVLTEKQPVSPQLGGDAARRPGLAVRPGGDCVAG